MCSISAASGVLARQAVEEHVHGNVADVEDLEEAVEALGDAAVGLSLRALLLGVDAHVPVRVEHQSAGARGLGESKDARRSSMTVRMSMPCSARCTPARGYGTCAGSAPL
jgi:hypothetical protein